MHTMHAKAPYSDGVAPLPYKNHSFSLSTPLHAREYSSEHTYIKFERLLDVLAYTERGTEVGCARKSPPTG